jgi:hypothetical protein
MHEPLVLVPFNVAGLVRTYQERQQKRTHFATCQYAPGMRLAVTMPPCHDFAVSAGFRAVEEEDFPEPINEIEA